jgi:hypothetical protein
MYEDPSWLAELLETSIKGVEVSQGGLYWGMGRVALTPLLDAV